MDVAPPAPDASRAVLPNNILVLSDYTRNSSISDFVEEGSCQPPDLPAEPPAPSASTPGRRLVCGPRPHDCPGRGEASSQDPQWVGGGVGGHHTARDRRSTAPPPRDPRGQGRTPWDARDLFPVDASLLGGCGGGAVLAKKVGSVPGLASPQGAGMRRTGEGAGARGGGSSDGWAPPLLGAPGMFRTPLGLTSLVCVVPFETLSTWALPRAQCWARGLSSGQGVAGGFSNALSCLPTEPSPVTSGPACPVPRAPPAGPHWLTAPSRPQ